MLSVNSTTDCPCYVCLCFPVPGTVVTTWYKTTDEGKALLSKAGLNGKEIHTDHLYPVSQAGTGVGIHHVANLYILTKQENEFFGDSTERWKLKMEHVGSVLCVLYSICFHVMPLAQHVMCFCRSQSTQRPSCKPTLPQQCLGCR